MYFPTTTINSMFLSSSQYVMENIFFDTLTASNLSVLYPTARRLTGKQCWQVSEAAEDHIQTKYRVTEQSNYIILQHTWSSTTVSAMIYIHVLRIYILSDAMLFACTKACCVEYKSVVFLQNHIDLQHMPTLAVRQTVTSLVLLTVMS